MQMVICEDRWCLTLIFFFSADAGTVFSKGWGTTFKLLERIGAWSGKKRLMENSCVILSQGGKQDREEKEKKS